MRVLDNVQDLQDIARGAVLLGTGGGGDPYIGELLLRAQMKRGRHATLLDPAEVDDSARVISIFIIGAPPPYIEHLVSEKLLARVLERVKEVSGRAPDALICGEIGGANCMVPLGVSAMSGIPTIDADGIGRAFPHMEMTTFSILGVRASPALLMDEFGNEAVLNTADDRTCEAVARAVCASLGAYVVGACYSMTGEQMKRCSVHRTVSQALHIGRTIRRARESSNDVAGQLVACLNTGERYACILFDGKIVDVVREIRDGWHWGRVTLRGLSNPQDEFTVDLQNEYTVARLNGRTIAIVPDLISIVDRETGEPLTGEALSYGQRVKVLGYGAHPLLRRPESLKVVGPRCFGIDEDYRTLEKLTAAAGSPRD